MTTFRKDPAATLDYMVDWTDWLDGDSIASVTWAVPAGLTETDRLNSGQIATIWLSGGAAGEKHKVACRITTAEGRVDERTLDILVVDR